MVSSCKDLHSLQFTGRQRPSALKKSGVANPSCIVIEMVSLNRVNSSIPDVTYVEVKNAWSSTATLPYVLEA